MPADQVLKVELALVANPFDALAGLAWTDVTDDVGEGQDVFCRRGKDFELDSTRSGVGGGTFANSDRKYDPTNTAGAYYPNIKPLKRIRFTSILAGVTYYLFTGYVERWPPTWEDPGYATTTVSIVDALALFSNANLVMTAPAEGTGARVNRVLDAIGWPAADRVVSAGMADCDVAVFAAGDKQKALQHLIDIERTEGSRIFIDGQGRVVFQHRHAQITSPYDTSQATFGDSGTDLAYESPVPSYDLDKLYNDVTYTGSSGVAQNAQDSASDLAYGPRSYPQSVLTPDDLDAHAAAEFVLLTHKDPALRLDSLTIPAFLSSTLQTQVLTRDLGDRVTFKKSPPGGGAQINVELSIESIEHRFSPVGTAIEWRTTYHLAPAGPTGFWVLQTSALDSTAKAAY